MRSIAKIFLFGPHVHFSMESPWGEFFQVGEWANFWLVGENPPARKALSVVVLLPSLYLQQFIFDTHLKTGKQRYNSNQKTSNCVAETPTEYISFNKILWFMMSNDFCKLIRTILLWPFVLHTTRCKWLWLKIEQPN